MVNLNPPWCPVCGHGMVRIYTRPWSKALRRAYWWQCVACTVREPADPPNRPTMTIDWPTFWVGVIVMVGVAAVAVYGFGRAVGSW